MLRVIESQRQAMFGLRTRRSAAGALSNGYFLSVNGKASPEPVPVKSPQVRTNTGEAVKFCSALIAPCIRKTNTPEAVLVWLYLKGVSGFWAGPCSPPPALLDTQDGLGLFVF